MGQREGHPKSKVQESRTNSRQAETSLSPIAPQSISFEDRIKLFLANTDVLTLHCCSIILFEPKESQRLEQIQNEMQFVKAKVDKWLNW